MLGGLGSRTGLDQSVPSSQKLSSGPDAPGGGIGLFHSSHLGLGWLEAGQSPGRVDIWNVSKGWGSVEG